jgi:hypothetical protein
VKYIQKHNEYVKHEIVPRVQAAGGWESAEVAADYLDDLFSTFIGMNDVGSLTDIDFTQILRTTTCVRCTLDDIAPISNICSM